MKGGCSCQIAQAGGGGNSAGEAAAEADELARAEHEQ